MPCCKVVGTLTSRSGLPPRSSSIDCAIPAAFTFSIGLADWPWKVSSSMPSVKPGLSLPSASLAGAPAMSVPAQPQRSASAGQGTQRHRVRKHYASKLEARQTQHNLKAGVMDGMKPHRGQGTQGARVDGRFKTPESGNAIARHRIHATRTCTQQQRHFVCAMRACVCIRDIERAHGTRTRDGA